MSFESLSTQQLKALVALRKDTARELVEDLKHTLAEIDILEDLINERNKSA